jgi:thymidylate kinase
MKGIFISFEGGEGSGKSSAITAIKNKSCFNRKGFIFN